MLQIADLRVEMMEAVKEDDMDAVGSSACMHAAHTTSMRMN